MIVARGVLQTGRAVLTDIEGTLGPVAFVREVLFPYAAAALPEFVRDHARDPQVAALLAEAAHLGRVSSSDLGRLTRCLLDWIAADAKVTPLKALQGLVWEEGYRGGHFRAPVYRDALDRLRAWRGAGVPVYVYSSGSIRAQDLYFAHTADGDLRPLFSGFFDTTTGSKQDPDSYRRIAEAIQTPPQDLLFLSDLTAELDAAAAAGLHTTWLVRPADTKADEEQLRLSPHPVARSFAEIRWPAEAV
jgi:enolase-phosphatase E1